MAKSFPYKLGAQTNTKSLETNSRGVKLQDKIFVYGCGVPKQYPGIFQMGLGKVSPGESIWTPNQTGGRFPGLSKTDTAAGSTPDQLVSCPRPRPLLFLVFQLLTLARLRILLLQPPASR